MSLLAAFRVDSGPQIGMGHLMRCLVLAQGLQEQGAELLFFCRAQTSQTLKHNLPSAHIYIVPDGLSETEDALYCQKQLQGLKHAPNLLIVDHYELGKHFETAMRTSVKRIMVMDDIARPHDCDLLLDANLTLAQGRYDGKVPTSCRLLLGPAYALLRPSFKQTRVRALARGKTDVKRIFLCFGGSDLHDVTQRSVQALSQLLPPDIAVDIVVGQEYGSGETLENINKKYPSFKLHVAHPQPEMLMAEADMAIGAGGTMNWERCALGLPSIVISIAKNQIDSCQALAARGAICYLGDYNKVRDAELREAITSLLDEPQKRFIMSEAMDTLVDAKGTDRIIQIIKNDLFC